MWRLFISFLLLSPALAFRWQESRRPKMVVDYLKQDADDVKTFLGNQTHSDHFKLLRQDGGSLLIGARNVVYNISLHDLEENLEERIEWNSRDRDTELCLVKGKSEEDCNNYIRVLAKQDNQTLLVCGTNSYNPRCRSYLRTKAGGYEVAREQSGRGYCPYDPRHNSTFMFTDGQLYSGTVADFSGSDALIIRNQLRTEQYNLKHLNGPNFVGSVEDEDYVYFFFREEAVEFMNCGKAVFSRVGRVCKKDAGGAHTFRNKWTTFVKARLNCSVPGQYPFYFDQIQSVSQIMKSKAGEDLVFGVFNTPENSITGSAVCSFSMTDIRDSFDGPFKAQQDVNSNWLPLSKQQQPRTRPGSCHANSKQLDDEHLNFLKENVLMDLSVPSHGSRGPHYIRTSPNERLTSIAVDPAVVTASGDLVDVIFVGTTRGRVLKLVSHNSGGEERTTLIEEIQLFPLHIRVSNILVETVTRSVVVLSEHEVKRFPLSRCERSSLSCPACVNLQDPYCAWNVASQTCSPLHDSKQDTSELLQNLHSGRHPGCPAASLSVSEPAYYGIAVDLDYGVYQPSTGPDPYFQEIFPRDLPLENTFMGTTSAAYSGKTLTLACSTTAIIALLLGFLTGYLFSRKCQKKESYLKCGHAYLEARGSQWPSDTKGGYLDCGFNTTTVSTTKNNLLVNMPEKSDPHKTPTKTSIAMTKNSTGVPTPSSMLNKCKRIYL